MSENFSSSDVKRVTDIVDIAALSNDFVRRDIRPSIFKASAFITAIFTVITLGVVFIDEINPTHLLFILGSMFLLCLLLVIIKIDALSNTIFSAEFENALFAGAAGTGVEFLLIIRRNHQIIYYNPSCRQYFTYTGPASTAQTAFHSLLQELGIEETYIHTLEEALINETRTEIPFRAKTNDDEGDDGRLLRLVLEPISRPRNFAVLKAIATTSQSLQKPNNEDTTLPNAIQSGSIQPFDVIQQTWLHILDLSPLAIAQLDTTATITRSNSAFQRLIGETRSSNGKSLFSFITPNDAETIRTALEKDTGDSSHDFLPIEIVLNDVTTVSVIITPVRTTDDVSGFIVYFLDMTEQKNLEQRFVHSQKMQAVGQLAGGIAHDFNNLLTAMIGFCDLLLMRHPPGEQSFADIMQIKQNANRAANLVRQLLAFSRKQTMQPEVIDLTDTLAELSHLIRRLIGENIDLDMQHGREIWPIKADPGQIEQVIINLAVNARDAMKENGGELTLRTSNITISNHEDVPSEFLSPEGEESIESGDYILIEVSDTGCGMSRAVVKQIFEPFYTTKEVGAGTGLGLSTVYGIVQQTGGSIYVKSKENKGTTFALYLKRHIDNKDNTTDSSDVTKKAKDLTGTGVILLVEDEVPVRMFSSRALKNKGYTVLEADCGETALDIVEERGDTIDIIITDVVMPGITGPTMITEVMKTHPNIKVIFISGYGEDAFISSYGSDREFNFLPKPFTLEQLAIKTKDVFDSDKS